MNTANFKGLIAAHASEYPLSKGLEDQLQDLGHWSSRVSNECYLALCNEAALRNGKMLGTAKGHDVWKGVQMESFVKTWRPRT